MAEIADVAADVVIVGAGVAGALVAERLAKAGARVAMLEAGARVHRAEALERFVSNPIKTPESPYLATSSVGSAPEHPISEDANHWYRQMGPDRFKSTYLKAVGGTTWHWLGTCLRFLPSDFHLRSRFGQGVDWPVDYATLEPFYLQAEQALGVAGDSSAPLGSPRSGPYPMPQIPVTWMDEAYARALAGTPYEVRATPQARTSIAWDGRPPCCGSASCIPICPVGAKYDAAMQVQKAERLGAQLHERTTATFIETDADNRVSGIRFLHADGAGGVARGRIYVLAAHAVETPRLLLHSRSERNPSGVANRSDQVGRNLMDHPIQLSWALAGEPVWPYRGPISTSGIENLRDGEERRHRASLRIQLSNDGWNWPTGGAETIGRDLAERGLRGRALRDAVADQLSRQIQLAALVEQLPSPQNRVVLDPQDKDRFGVPLPRLHYDIGDYARAGLAAAREAHAAVFARMQATAIQHRSEFEGAGHIIGTCRMGEHAGTSVVNPSLRCHDHSNLYLAGSAAFPTSGTANPTLTIAALSLRLADTVEAALTSGA